MGTDRRFGRSDGSRSPFFTLYVGVTATIVETSSIVVIGWLMPGIIAGLGCFAAAHAVGGALGQNAPLITLAAQVASCGVVALLILVALDRNTVLSFSKLLMPVWIDGLANRLLGANHQG